MKEWGKEEYRGGGGGGYLIATAGKAGKKKKKKREKEQLKTIIDQVLLSSIYGALGFTFLYLLVDK